jgi:hypothetical protein
MRPARRRLDFFSAAILAVLAVLLPAGIMSAATGPAAETRVWAIASAAQDHVRADRLVSADQRLGEAAPCPFYAPGACVAPEAGLNVEGANFAQRTFSSTFRGGSLAGRSISDVAGDLGSGALTPKDVPVGMIVRNGNSLILNTRSAQALMQAGIPRSAWSVIDQTGDPFFEELLTGQLTRNGLDSGGFPYPTPSGG